MIVGVASEAVRRAWYARSVELESDAENQRTGYSFLEGVEYVFAHLEKHDIRRDKAGLLESLYRLRNSFVMGAASIAAAVFTLLSLAHLRRVVLENGSRLLFFFMLQAQANLFSILRILQSLGH
jgi:hypothetical protein